jgi:hypothetical protein
VSYAAIMISTLSPRDFLTRYSRRELSQLMPYHILRDGHIMINLPIVDLELQPYEVGQDGRGARLCLDGRRLLSGSGADDI